MALQDDDDGMEKRSKKNLLLIISAIIPVWGIVLFVGWFVISSLVPVLDEGKTNVLANESSDPFVLNFNTAAGKSDSKPEKAK
ncbi:MAG: hypothetical protein RIB59_06480 [Rhodospirillales bacterium]